MKQVVSKALFNYWDSLRGGRSTPERKDIDPAAIRNLLCDTFILEVEPRRNYPIRVIGARINALFLRELKGTDFISIVDRADRDDLRAVLESVLDDPAPAVLGVSAGPYGRQPLELEMLLLPLRHLGRTHARILGSLTPAARPSWYGLIPVDCLNLTSLRIIRSTSPAQDEDAYFGNISLHDAGHTLTDVPLRRRHLSIYSGGLERSRLSSE